MTYNITPANSTFSNTCPLLVHYEPARNIAPTTCAAIVAGVYIARPPVTNIFIIILLLLFFFKFFYVARPPVTNFATVNLANANAAHPLQNCRLYHSQIQMEPQHAITYNNSQHK